MKKKKVVNKLGRKIIKEILTLFDKNEEIIFLLGKIRTIIFFLFLLLMSCLLLGSAIMTETGQNLSLSLPTGTILFKYSMH